MKDRVLTAVGGGFILFLAAVAILWTVVGVVFAITVGVLWALRASGVL